MNHTFRKVIGILLMGLSLLPCMIAFGIIGVSIISAIALPPLFFWIIPLVLATTALCFSLGNAIYYKADNDGHFNTNDKRFFMAQNKPDLLKEILIAPYARLVNVIFACFVKKEEYKSEESLDFNLDSDEDSSNEEIQLESPTEQTAIIEKVPNYSVQECAEQTQMRFG